MAHLVWCSSEQLRWTVRARLIFAVKWDIWFTWRRPASSSNNTGEELRLQNRPKLHYLIFFSLLHVRHFLVPICLWWRKMPVFYGVWIKGFVESMSDLLNDNGHTCSGLTSKFQHFRLLTCTYVLSDGVKQEESVCVCECVYVSSYVQRGRAVLKHLLSILALSSIMTCELSSCAHMRVSSEWASNSRCF